MIAFLDSDICIYLFADTYPNLTRRVAEQEEGSLAVSAVTFAELALGSEGGKGPPMAVLDRFVSAVPLLPFDAAAARAYATLPFRRARFDRLLAAHALSLGATIVTNNVADFSDVRGLRVENWIEGRLG